MNYANYEKLRMNHIFFCPYYDKLRLSLLIKVISGRVVLSLKAIVKLPPPQKIINIQSFNY